MMRTARPVLAFLALYASWLPAGVAAQRYEVSRKEAEIAMATFAACEVKSPAGREAALGFTREVSGTSSDYPQRLIRSRCAPRGTTMRFQPSLFRIALFPALYARDFAASPLPDLAKAPVADYAREFDGSPSDETLALRRFGDCVVRRDAASSRTLVLSKLYSGEEQAAITAIEPAMAQCVGVDGQVRFSRTVARGAIAEALYKSTAAVAAPRAN